MSPPKTSANAESRVSGECVEAVERVLAARVLDTLLREDYAGLRGFVDGAELRLPAEAGVRLRTAGFLADLMVDPAQELSLERVLAAVRRLADPRDDVDAFARECRETLATLLLHEQVKPQVLAKLPTGDVTGPGTYYDTLAAYTDHPVYPMSRCRVGLSEDDLRGYAPEFNPVFRLRWAAVPRAAVTRAGERPGWWPTMAVVGLPEDLDASHDLFPMHPLTAAAETGFVLAPEPYLKVTPTLSMRTVALAEPPSGHQADPLTHVKVPLPTSTLGLRNRRSIVPRTLHDGALVERMLRDVLKREPALPVLLADEQTYGHAGDPMLGYLIRRYPAETLGAHVLPVAALLAEEPGGRYVIERWDVRALFDAYLAALFAWNVMLFRHGIVLEAHQQNVSLVLRDGTVDGLKLLLKDNDGALVDTEPGTFADARMVTADREAAARVFVTITLHLCAGAVAFGLAERGLLPLRTGLAMIRRRLDEALGPEDGFLRARTLTADRLPTKAMVTAGTLVDKARTGARDINKHYGPSGPNYLLQDDTCC